jgi:predicted Zn-dependent protease
MVMKNNVLLGFSEVDITPSSNVQTIGFNRKDNLSSGVLHKLYAQISIWISEEEKCCLLAIDHIGFSYEESNILRNEIANKLEVTCDKIMLCFSHTHSAPNISIEQEYFNLIRKQVLLAVGEAEKNTAPIKAVWGKEVADIGINRRDEHGVLDRRVGVLKIVDADTDNLRLLVLRVTAHGNVLLRDNYLISSDFIGVTRKLLEEKYG